MFDRLIGKYLEETGKLSHGELIEVYKVQDTKRARLGVIAVSEKLITIAQAEEINNLQATENKKFGEIAIEKGYLNDTQVKRLLELQGNEFLVFTQAIVDLEYMTLDEINNVVEEYRKTNGLLTTDIDALKNNDIERIIPIYFDIDDENIRNMFVYGVTNIFRLVDRHVSIGKVFKTTNFKAESFGYQKIHGDENVVVGIAARPESARAMAISYTSESFIETSEDALDAICELINCINGLYATEASKNGKSLELEPPFFNTSYAEISGNELYIMPVHLTNGEVTYIIGSGNIEIH